MKTPRAGLRFQRTARLLAAWALLSPISSAVFAQVPRELRISKTANSDRANFVAAPVGQAIPVKPGAGRLQPVPIDFFLQYGHLFGIDQPFAQLRETATRTDQLGHTSTTFEQFHLGVPVFSGMLKVHRNDRGEFLAANGDFHPLKPGLGTVPRITAEEAVAFAQRAVAPIQPQAVRADLVVVDPGWYGDRTIGARLAYHVILRDLSVPLREAFFVDAHAGEVLDQWSTLHDSRFRLVHDYIAGSDCCRVHAGVGCDDEACEAVVCGLRDSCCSTGWDVGCAVRAAGACDGLCIPGSLARSEGDPPTASIEVDAVYDYLGDAYEYFSRAFGRDGIDDMGLTLRGVANWGFACPNAFWDPDLLLAVFCPGVSPDDVVAHELTHGLTQLTAELIYQNQPGQLNESFSDVFGELVDLYNGGADRPGVVDGSPWESHSSGPGGDAPNLARTSCSPVGAGHPDGLRWLISEDATIAFGGPIRDMWDPTCLGDPDRANSPLQTCDFFDNGGVHSGSGIPNHAFALVTDGGHFNGFNVRGIGPVKSGAVWYRTLTTYLSVASDFQSAYVAFNQAAQDLIGNFPNDPRTGTPSGDVFTADDAQQVDRALRAVEMHTPGRCGRVTPVLRSDPVDRCLDAVVIFEDGFESGVDSWTVENSGPPTPYDWEQRSQLPFGRPGTAWYVADASIGDCRDVFESALHSLRSPVIEVPSEAGFVYASFDHYVETEPAFDGGLIRVRVNGGSWTAVSPSAIENNSYNTFLRVPTALETANPLAGQTAWTGVGGEWGTSIVNLSEWVSAGDAFELRFDFGKDGCVGHDGWYVDDLAVYSCGDCNQNGVVDQQEIHFLATSGPLTPFGINASQTMHLSRPPRATGDVTLRMLVSGDFASDFEFVRVKLNAMPIVVGTAFVTGGSDCPETPDGATLTIPRESFNAARSRGSVDIHVSTSVEVAVEACRHGSFVNLQVDYPAAGVDADGNQVLDACEGCSVAAAATGENPAIARNRYLAVVPGSPGRLTALRLRVDDAPLAFAALVGAEFWIDRPFQVAEAADRLGDLAPERNFFSARLTCEPVFYEFGEHDVIYVHDAAVVPGARYLVSVVDYACGASSLEHYSPSLAVRTARWGDVSGLCNAVTCDAPDGSVQITDVVAVLDKFNNLTNAISKTRADVSGSIPNRLVDMEDVARILDAFRAERFPYPVPPRCSP